MLHRYVEIKFICQLSVTDVSTWCKNGSDYIMLTMELLFELDPSNS